jgi:hypothetical protein
MPPRLPRLTGLASIKHHALFYSFHFQIWIYSLLLIKRVSTTCSYLLIFTTQNSVSGQVIILNVRRIIKGHTQVAK